jgi:hypothetical protein
MSDLVRSEVHGVFTSESAMQEAVSKLTLAGFDRAELSLPVAHPDASQATPEQSAGAVGTETDTRQMRTLLSSTAGVSGAMIGAAITLATGGAALPAVAAAAGGAALLGGGTAAATSAVGDSQKQARDQAAEDGTLVLAVHAASAERAERAEATLHAAGAASVKRVIR